MEQWKQIEGYEVYAVSTDGRVKNVKTGRIMKQHKNHKGYWILGLTKNGKQKSFRVNRLVALAFIPNDNPQEKTEVNHIDENKDNNCVDNLEWVSPKENMNHGTVQERKGKKLSETMKGTPSHLRIKIKCVELDRIFESLTEASQELGLHVSNLSYCLSGKYKTCGGFHWEFVEEK